MRTLLATFAVTVMWFGSAHAGQRVVSINPCFDDWLPQWLAPAWQVVPSTEHGNRLEQIVALKPDYVVAGSFVGRQLRLALQERVQLTTVPYVADWSAWREAVLQLGLELEQKYQAEQWLARQEAALASYDLRSLGNTLILMPNGFTWGGQSWIYQLLQQHQLQLSPLSGSGDLVRLNLEQVLQSEPDTVILEGFSTEYARAQDWLWHDGLQDWLIQRRVIEVDGQVASCAATRALDYLQQLSRQQDANPAPAEGLPDAAR
ncbi:hypothetical protein [Pseudidiomarina terrestris]|uniref:Fe/B12 periplasmic-binding domain-containing protein n=1 Tax=Pseudidiomarina terrestris TaxID=2820060 RepID=A0ABT8ML28_9GAMM|nr:MULTISPECIES: hypothetical protein [unclassified Pseudidiomarina]MDN7128137.1 hypothetical protein [Pseudidiomarina sp. 1APR75-33.1]MDN7130665.1 hypothetical protein [Pseudidiomarina sp. 1APR75-15]MDN7136580.1 hypothetical protein [Pseudidiomarina sp. 1ASP75-5]